jgi:hypothetical protein
LWWTVSSAANALPKDTKAFPRRERLASAASQPLSFWPLATVPI